MNHIPWEDGKVDLNKIAFELLGDEYSEFDPEKFRIETQMHPFQLNLIYDED